MNKYILANSISPTNDILAEDIIKSMVWLGLSTESTSEDIVAAGYVVLPELTTAPTSTEVSVAIKDQAGVWSLINIPFTDWQDIIKTRAATAMFKLQRNKLLAASDWTQGKDIPTNISGPWAVYRQALRDLTSQEGFPNTVTWPTLPAREAGGI